MTASFQQESVRSELPALSAAMPEEQQSASARHLAHDARNWLTVLQVYCDLLRTSGTVARKGRNWIDELSNAVERGQGLVTSLLDSVQASTSFQTFPAEKATTGSKTLDLAAVIRARIPLFRQMAGNTIVVESKTLRSAETTSLQAPEFDRILLNLIRNGIEAMPQGGRLRIELEYGTLSERRPLVLRVSDTGKGIPADILPRIFESGFSTKSSARHPESDRGYGLAIVRHFALAAGGSVRVRSRMGHGTCFTVELPAPLGSQRPAISQRRGIASASKRAMQPLSRTRQPNNFGSVRKGTRVPC